jgi:alkanesulfonate monooxygenase SsuD/methylene tetrahydromethanopterin reductase-like flavin-dependent oxidoreductase (luciferase family)
VTSALEKQVSFEEQYFTFADMQGSPELVQPPHPQIWNGGNNPRARRRVAKLGDG